MNLLELLGAFCVGLSVVFLVRLGLTALESGTAKVFTGITAAVIGAGALVLAASIRDSATAWPNEFWAYPVGLAVGLSLSKVLWKKPGQSKDEFNFKLEIAGLMVCAVLLLWSPELLPELFPRTIIPKVVGEIIRALGEAILIASVLAATVDLYIKLRTYREISTDVFKFLIGYGLPDEFKDRIREIVTNSDLVRRDSSIIWDLRPVDGDQNTFRLDYKVIYKLQNLTSCRKEYQFKTSKSPGEEQETRLTRLWGKFPQHHYNYHEATLKDAPTETEPSGRAWIKGDKVWVDSENVVHGLDFKVGADYESKLRRQFDFHVFAYPTLGAVVSVEHPKEWKVLLSPRVEGEPDVDPVGVGRLRTTWTYKRLFFKEDAIFLDWALEENPSGTAGQASKALEPKVQEDQKRLATPSPEH